ncbi:MAG: hypothetical protein Q6354_02585 [Candidatus Brocadiales bacterium]|nr:hypothetical protein [Candidatus Brocadiales bacterium]
MFYTLFFAFLLFIARPSFSDTGGWAATYGGVSHDEAHSIQQTREGGYIVAGVTRSFSAEDYDIWVLKLSSGGAVEWQKTYGGDRFDWANSIQETGDGGYILAGGTWSFGAGEADVWVLKLRLDGAVEWQKTYGGRCSDAASSVQQSREGGYVLAGVRATSIGAGGEGIPDIWVLKLRLDGSVEWEKTYGGVNSDRADSIQQTRDGGYIVAGLTDSFGAGDADIWVLKLSPDGTLEWQKTYGGVRYDWARSIQQTSDGCYIVAGHTGSFDVGQNDVWVLKLSPNGSIDPPCKFMRDTSASGGSNDTTILDTTASARDSNANPQDSSAIISATNVTPHILCP